MAEDRSGALAALVMSTFAFTVCFAAWTMNAVLVTYLVQEGVFAFDRGQIGVLLAVPILTGALMRLPVGMLTDILGGRIVFTVVMLIAAMAQYLVSTVNGYAGFVAASLGFGLTGATFAVGIAYVSVWFPKEKQGTVLGIFGLGNAGVAVTSIGGPRLLGWLTEGGANLEGWRTLPKVYAAALAITAVAFFVLTKTRKPQTTGGIAARLAPLRNMRVWRFGFYYFLLFGAFVALSQWLIPYFVNVYGMSVATAGLLAAAFSLPSGVIRAAGGWMSDRWGARTVMYSVYFVCILGFLFLSIPRMIVRAPGEGVMAGGGGRVAAVEAGAIVVGEKSYPLIAPDADPFAGLEDEVHLLPVVKSWQEPAVAVGDEVSRRDLLARGVTEIYFQANLWIFAAVIFVVGCAMGIGKAAVYKHIPDYFPGEVGVTGGMVGVLGALGGFFCPIFFGQLLRMTGLWASCWWLLFWLAIAGLFWMHVVVQRMVKRKNPELSRALEGKPGDSGRLPVKA